jgi:hypothetical protein
MFDRKYAVRNRTVKREKTKSKILEMDLANSTSKKTALTLKSEKDSDNIQAIKKNRN